jgi:hypothetical protein
MAVPSYLSALGGEHRATFSCSHASVVYNGTAAARTLASKLSIVLAAQRRPRRSGAKLRLKSILAA